MDKDVDNNDLPTPLALYNLSLESGESEENFLVTDLYPFSGFKITYVYQSHHNVFNTEVKLGAFTFQLILTSISVLINLRVFCIVVHKLWYQWSVLGILMAHITALMILSNVQQLVQFSVDSQIIKIQADYAPCGLWSFLGNAINALIQINATVIIYERVEKSKQKDPEAVEDIKVYRILFFLWCLAAVGSIHYLHSFEFSKDWTNNEGVCVKIMPAKLEAIYQLFRFIGFYVGTCFYTAWALYKVRSNLNHSLYIWPIRNLKKRQREHVLRFAYVFAVLSFILMLPAGLLFGMFEMLVSGFIDNFGAHHQIVWIKTMGLLLYYIYCMISPMVFVCVHEDMRTRKVLGYGWIRLLVIRVMASEIFRATDPDNEEEAIAIVEAVVQEENQGQIEIGLKEEEKKKNVEMCNLSEIPEPAAPEEKNIENEPKPSNMFKIPVIVETLVMSDSSSDIGTFV